MAALFDSHSKHFHPKHSHPHFSLHIDRRWVGAATALAAIAAMAFIVVTPSKKAPASDLANAPVFALPIDTTFSP